MSFEGGIPQPSVDQHQADVAPPPQKGPSGARGWPVWVKLIIVSLLLVSLGWVLLLLAQYCKTEESFGDLPALPRPVGDLLERDPQYSGSLYGVQRPMGVAVSDDGRIYVAESGGERKVHVFDKAGQEISSFAPPDTEVTSRVPVYVAISPEGEIYVSDRDAATIYIFSEEGALLGQVESPLPDGGSWHPLGLTFDDAGNLYVTDVTPEKHRVLVLDPAGELKLSFGKEGEAAGEFWFPNSVALDGQGRIYVSDSNNGRVQAFDGDGNFLFMIGRSNAESGLSLPRGIAIDDDDNLFVVDTSRSLVQVYDVSEGLEFRYAFGDEGAVDSSFSFPNGLALDGRGQIYVTDRENDRVQVWSY